MIYYVVLSLAKINSIKTLYKVRLKAKYSNTMCKDIKTSPQEKSNSVGVKALALDVDTPN